jgi:hypothetical protein
MSRIQSTRERFNASINRPITIESALRYPPTSIDADSRPGGNIRRHIADRVELFLEFHTIHEHRDTDACADERR